MDVKGMKVASAIEWWPNSFCIHAYNQKNALKLICTNLIEYMSSEIKYDGKKY